MKSALLVGGTAILLMAGSCTGAAQNKGYWRAASNTAGRITGDLTITDSKLTIDFTAFPISQIRILKPAEVSAAFDADLDAGGTGALYRLMVPASKRFLHHNTLCGTADTLWMATYLSGKTLQVAFFSGDNAPEFTMNTLANSPDLCGTYRYIR